MSDGLSLSVDFRKIPAWKIPCPPHTTLWAFLDNSDSTEKTPETSSRGCFHQKKNAPFFLGVPLRPASLRDGPG